MSSVRLIQCPECKALIEEGVPCFACRVAEKTRALAGTERRREIFEAIEAERQKQDAEWGGPEHDDMHSALEWCAFVEDHASRAKGHIFGADPEGYAYQLVRVAALAVAALESHNRQQEK